MLVNMLVFWLRKDSKGGAAMGRARNGRSRSKVGRRCKGMKGFRRDGCQQNCDEHTVLPNERE